MMASERRLLGFDRPLHLEWLDAAAGQSAAGASAAEARKFVWNLLEGLVSGTTPQSGRGKTLTVLGRIWLTVSTGNEELRSDALELIDHVGAEERLGLHWTMMAAAYPFFVDLAASAGKLLALNGSFTAAQLNRRIVDSWGDRSTVRVAAQRLIRSMVQWGALADGSRSGVYVPRERRIPLSSSVSALLVEALVIAAGSGTRLDLLVGHAATFPFDLRLATSDLRRHARFRVHSQGDGTDFVELARVPKSGPVTAKRPELAGTVTKDGLDLQASAKPDREAGAHPNPRPNGELAASQRAEKPSQASGTSKESEFASCGKGKSPSDRQIRIERQLTLHLKSSEATSGSDAGATSAETA